MIIDKPGSPGGMGALEERIRLIRFLNRFSGL